MQLQDIEDGILEIGVSTDIAGIRILESGKPGPTIGLMGMLHGDEPAGLGLWDLMIQSGPPSNGTVYMIVGHPDAICHKDGPVRSIEQDINRLFGTSRPDYDQLIGPDHVRCIALERLLPALDLLIDIHSTSAPTQPFVVMPSKRCKYINLAKDLPITQLYGLDQFLDKTATSWLTRQCKTAIMIEVGQHKSLKGRAIAADVARRILNSLQMLRQDMSNETEPMSYEKRFVAILGQIRAENAGFKFTKNRTNFEPLQAGELIATDKVRNYNAPLFNNMLICLPTAMEGLRDRVSTEAYYVGLDLEFVRSALDD